MQQTYVKMRVFSGFEPCSTAEHVELFSHLQVVEDKSPTCLKHQGQRTNSMLGPETGRCAAEGQGQEIKSLHGEINSTSLTEMGPLYKSTC